MRTYYWSSCGRVRYVFVSASSRVRGQESDSLQILDLHCFARKGVGADHAKFSPVGKSSLLSVPSTSHKRNMSGFPVLI